MSANSTVVSGRSVMRAVLWNDLFRTSRRASRYEYWWGTIQVTVVLFVSLLLAIAASETLPEKYVVPTVTALGAVIVLSFIAGFTLQVRRLHDLGMNWWWTAIMYAFNAASILFEEYIENLRLDRYLFVQWDGDFFEGAMSLTWLDGLGNGIWLMLFIMSGFFIGDDGTNQWGKGPAMWHHRWGSAAARPDWHTVDEPYLTGQSPWSRGDEGRGG